MDIVRGQKIEICPEKDPVLGQIKLSIDSFQEEYELNFYSFASNATAITSENIQFYLSPCNTFIEYNEEEKEKYFDIDLYKVPQNIIKIIIGINVYKLKKQANKPAKISVQCQQKSFINEIFSFTHSLDSNVYETYILGEFYLYQGMWKFSSLLYKGKNSIFREIEKITHKKICVTENSNLLGEKYV